MDLLASRKCWASVNPLHSLIYFAPEAAEEFTALGLEGWSLGYFAGRAAPMGAVGAGAVAAAFYNFNPELVARHIPRAWELAGPDAVLAARLRAADRALRRLLGEDVVKGPEVAEAAELALAAAGACEVAGRPLYAGHADLPVPEEPHLALWHAATLLREHRGDGHIAALVGAELGGLEALVTHTATGKGFVPDFARSSRGWSMEQWEAAEAGLRERGLLDAGGGLTERGRELRREVEDRTDRLAHAPYRELGQERVARLTGLAGELAGIATGNGAFRSDIFARR